MRRAKKLSVARRLWVRRSWALLRQLEAERTAPERQQLEKVKKSRMEKRWLLWAG